MKENRSLQLSYQINQLLQRDLLGLFYELFPFSELSRFDTGSARDRVFNYENTILTMILTMTENDKSLHHSVEIFSGIHDRNKARIDELDKKIQQEYKNPQGPRRKGRPRETIGRIARSKRQEISHNTSAYSQARKRLPIEAMEVVYRDSADFSRNYASPTWHDRKVFITDGTYLQMQDTEDIKSKFYCPECKGYPRGLLQVIIEQGSGSVFDFVLESEKKSELFLFSKMIKNIPPKSLLLADDLYNAFAIFALLSKQGVDIIVPGKRARKYKVIHAYGAGDEIVEIKKKNNPKWLAEDKIDHNTLKMRRIAYKNSCDENQELILYTSLIDQDISKEEIVMKYEKRWDIEICIREIKTIMDVNIVRSKSADMAYKEVLAALTAYNYIRKIIAQITECSDFSPERDIIQKCYEGNKHILVDKLGRKYSRWSPGRYGYTDESNTIPKNNSSTGSALFEEN